MIESNKQYFELLKKHFNVSEYHLDLEIIKNPPPDYIEYFFQQLEKHEKYEELKGDFLYDKDFDIFIQIHNRIPFSEISESNKEAMFFYPFMSKDEIEQIFNIKTPEDYLLSLRAEQIENSIRLKRTFSKLRKKMGENWSFTNYFDSSKYTSYLEKLDFEKKELCKNIPHGTIHSPEANGLCLKTPFGNIITLSYSLRYFLYYMNIFQLGEHLGIPQKDMFNAFIIAIRIMIGTESLDFEIDTRGDLPEDIKKEIDFATDWQMSFIIGHEYAHHYLKHLENESHLKSHTRISYLNNEPQFYNYRQKCEFEADFHSINETSYDKNEKTELINGAFLFFTFLDMYYKIEDYIFPKNNGIKTHPEPLDRIWKLRDKIDENFGLSVTELTDIIDYNENFMDNFLNNYLPYNVERIEMIGSIYLPSYKIKYLIDRLDI